MKLKKLFIGIFLTLSFVLIGLTSFTKVYAYAPEGKVVLWYDGGTIEYDNFEHNVMYNMYQDYNGGPISGFSEYITFAKGNNAFIDDSHYWDPFDVEIWVGRNMTVEFYDRGYYQYPIVLLEGMYRIKAANGTDRSAIEIWDYQNTARLGQFQIQKGDTEFKVIPIVQDNKTPVISGQTTFVTNVNDAKPISFFMSYLSATDETDGDVTDSLIVTTDNYTPNKSVLGNHTFTVEASDSSDNKATATINVRVVDIDAPTITGNTSVATIGYTETWNINSFKSTLNVSDNYDTLTHQDIGIKSDGYTSKKTTLGTYTVVFNVFDSSDNEGTFSKSVRVVDNVKPTFSGPTIISTSNNTLLSESDVRAQLTASDFIDGNVTNKITLVEDNYSGKGNKVGSYTIIYSVADNAGNTATHTVTIQRIDEIPPTIWVVDGVSIRVTPTTPIDRETIVDILEATGQLTVNATTTFSFPLDEYSGNEETPGIYSMSVKSRSTTGNEYIHSFSIQVLDVDGEDDEIVITEKTWLQENIVLVSVVGVIGLAGLVLYFRKRR